jgi:lipocalin
MARVSEIKSEVRATRGRYAVLKDNLHAKQVVVGDGERRRRYILCYNPKEAQRQKKYRHDIVPFLE